MAENDAHFHALFDNASGSEPAFARALDDAYARIARDIELRLELGEAMGVGESSAAVREVVAIGIVGTLAHVAERILHHDDVNRDEALDALVRYTTAGVVALANEGT